MPFALSPRTELSESSDSSGRTFGRPPFAGGGDRGTAGSYRASAARAFVSVSTSSERRSMVRFAASKSETNSPRCVCALAAASIASASRAWAASSRRLAARPLARTALAAIAAIASLL